MTTTTTTKKANYSPAQESAIIEAMLAVEDHDQQVAAILKLDNSDLFADKNQRSISAKFSSLSRSNKEAHADLMFYKKPTGTTKNGEKVTSKADLVGQVAVKLGKDEIELDSLSKATKTVIEFILAGLPDPVSLAAEADGLGDLDTVES